MNQCVWQWKELLQTTAYPWTRTIVTVRESQENHSVPSSYLLSPIPDLETLSVRDILEMSSRILRQDVNSETFLKYC